MASITLSIKVNNATWVDDFFLNPYWLSLLISKGYVAWWSMLWNYSGILTFSQVRATHFKILSEFPWLQKGESIPVWHLRQLPPAELNHIFSHQHELEEHIRSMEIISYLFSLSDVFFVLEAVYQLEAPLINKCYTSHLIVPYKSPL